MSKLVNQVKVLIVSMFNVRTFEDKHRVFKFDHQSMNKFEFIRCSKNVDNSNYFFAIFVLVTFLYDPFLMVLLPMQW